MPDDSASHDNFDFSAHALRLSGRDILIIFVLVTLFLTLAPRLWTKAEKFERGPDYRIPYQLSDDYWLYQRHLQEAAADPRAVFVVGDSVIWGEYVRPNGTLSHYLGDLGNRERTFVNAGVNGLFPLALEGLVRDFGEPLNGRKVLLHANLLWTTSPEADLSARKEQSFNHQALVPQFTLAVPSYHAPFDRRVSRLASRKLDLLAWRNHLQISYFNQMSIPEWTVVEENAWTAPYQALRAGLPTEPKVDPDRGPQSARHKSWSDGTREGKSFDWVTPADSLQFAAFQRLVRLLRDRDNDLLVVIGPLNEHMIAENNRGPYRDIRDQLRKWLSEQNVPHLSPPPLPSELYGDASHPLTEGYRRLAEELVQSPVLKTWLE